MALKRSGSLFRGAPGALPGAGGSWLHYTRHADTKIRLLQCAHMGLPLEMTEKLQLGQKTQLHGWWVEPEDRNIWPLLSTLVHRVRLISGGQSLPEKLPHVKRTFRQTRYGVRWFYVSHEGFLYLTKNLQRFSLHSILCVCYCKDQSALAEIWH